MTERVFLLLAALLLLLVLRLAVVQKHIDTSAQICDAQDRELKLVRPGLFSTHYECGAKKVRIYDIKKP